MAAGDLALAIVLTASDQASGIIAELSRGISGMAGGGALGMVANVALAAGAAVVGVGIAAVKAAGDFEQMTNTLVTSAGESRANLENVRQGILSIAVQTGTSTDQLAKAMYQIESSGQHGADGLNVLKVAAMGAKSENADLEVVSKALTTVLTDYHMKSGDASKAMNGLIAVVSSGKTTLQELSGSMGAVLPIASALGISFPQVGGALATMTNAGMSARQAAQNLAHVLLALQSPSGVAIKSMQAVGLSAQDVKDALVNKGLPEALQMIEDQVGKKFPKGSVEYETAIKNITGGIVGFKLAAMLTGKSLQDTEDNIKKVAAAMRDGSGAVAGFDVVQSSFNFKMDQAKEAIQVLLISLGTKLLPILGKLLDAITPLIVGFTSWLVSTDKTNSASALLHQTLTIVSNVVKALTPVFQATWAVLQQVGAFLVTTFKPVWDQLVTTWKTQLIPAWQQFMDALGPAMPALKVLGEFILGALVLGLVTLALTLSGMARIAIFVFGLLVQGISATASMFLNGVTAIGNIVGWLIGVWNALPGFFSGLWEGIKSTTVSAWNGIVSFFVSVWQSIVGTVQSSINTVVSWFSWLYNHDYYFQMLVDSIRVTVDAGLKWLASAWASMSTTAVVAWNLVKNVFASAWNTYIAGPLTSLWNSISAWWTKTQTSSQKSATDLWSKVSSVFSSAWNYIAGPLASLQSSISGWFNSIISAAYNWGKNLIQGFINGINSMLTQVSQAASNVAAAAAKLIGIHSPAEEGPLSHLMEWGPNLVQTFADGIQAGIPAVNAAFQGLMSPLASSSNLSISGSGRFGGSSTSSTINMPTTTQPMIIYMMIDRRQIGKIVTEYQAGELRVQAGIRSR